MFWQYIVVGIIIVAALVYLIRHFVGKTKRCDCSCSEHGKKTDKESTNHNCTCCNTSNTSCPMCKKK